MGEENPSKDPGKNNVLQLRLVLTTTVWCVPLILGNNKRETTTVRVMFFYGHLCLNFYCVNFHQITHIFLFLKEKQGLVYEYFFGSRNDIADRNIKRRRGTYCIE